MPCAGREPLSLVSKGRYPKNPPSVPARFGTGGYAAVSGGTFPQRLVRFGTFPYEPGGQFQQRARDCLGGSGQLRLDQWLTATYI